MGSHLRTIHARRWSAAIAADTKRNRDKYFVVVGAWYYGPFASAELAQKFAFSKKWTRRFFIYGGTFSPARVGKFVAR